MRRPYFFDDMLVFSDDLNFLNDSKEAELTNRFQNIFTESGGIFSELNYNSSVISKGGVFGIPSEYLSYKNLKARKISPDIISIYPGKALTEAGELINVTNTLTVLIGDDFGNRKWTPSPNVLNYIKIKYLETASAPQTDDLGNSYNTRYTEGVFVTIDSVAPVAGEVLLGSFTASSTGEVSAADVTDRRLYLRVIASASSTFLDPTSKPIAEHVTVEDHIKSIGSGTPTPNNPHGLTALDLGFSDISDHIKQSHIPAIVSLNNVYSSAVYDSWKPTATDLGSEVVIAFNPPDSNAAIIVGGNVFTDELDTISLLDGVFFSEGDGGYTLYIDNSGSVKADAFTTGDGNSDRYNLCYFVRGGAGSEISNFTDLRKYRTLDTSAIRVTIPEAAVAPSTILSVENTLEHNLMRIRYQIGKAINGNGASWNSATAPLTAGNTSNADAYHTHTRTHSSNFIINFDAANGDLEDMSLRFYRGSNTGYASLYWDKDVDMFKLFANEASQLYSDLTLNTILLDGNVIYFESNEYAPGIVPSGSEIAGDPLNVESDSSLIGSLSLPCLKWRHSENYLDLLTDEVTNTYGRLRLSAININGQYVDAARIQTWDGVDFTQFQESAAGNITNGGSLLLYTINNTGSRPVYVKALIGTSFNIGIGNGGGMKLTLTQLPSGSANDVDWWSYSTLAAPAGVTPGYTAAMDTIVPPNYKVELWRTAVSGILSGNWKIFKFS